MNLRILAIGCGTVVIAIVGFIIATPIITALFYVDPEPRLDHVMQLAQQIDVKDVREVYIHIESPPQDHYYYTIILIPETDKEDIERLLQAIKTSWLAKEPVRVQNSSSTINFQAKGGFYFHGCFDPSIAPLVSNRLRSNTLSKVVQDIVKRKGEKIRSHLNKDTGKWEYK